MFTAAQLAPLPYKDPWSLTFQERLSALSAKERRIAYFYERPDTSTFRYRIFNMVEALNASPVLGISASWFTLDDLCYMESFIDRADVLVICRTRYRDGVNRMVTRARARGIRIFFDSDDFVFDPSYIHLIIDTLSYAIEPEEVWDNWFAYVGRLNATLRMCDEAIVTNEFLAARVKVLLPGIKPRIVPNFLNRMQQQISNEIWDLKLASGFARNDQIHIGYFSGTPTHNRDFEVIAPALAKLLDEDSRLVLRVVGFLDRKEPLLRHQDRIEVFPFQDFLNLQRLIGEVEINVAPLQDNVFTNCKSELKYFEAAIVGTATVASPTFTFQKAISEGENGFLANGHEWGRAISLAIETVDDPADYSAMAECSYLHAREKYSWHAFGPLIASAVFGDSDEGVGDNRSLSSTDSRYEVTKQAR
ncbi:MAG: glycosyltransferase [Acidobacteriota bacterium]|nr:glycosyltransferase [Acidobacteriota bacterium]